MQNLCMYIITNPAKLSGKNGILKKIDLRDFYSYAAKNGLSGNTSRAIGKLKLRIESPRSCAPSGAQGAASIRQVWAPDGSPPFFMGGRRNTPCQDLPYAVNKKRNNCSRN